MRRKPSKITENSLTRKREFFDSIPFREQRTTEFIDFFCNKTICPLPGDDVCLPWSPLQPGGHAARVHFFSAAEGFGSYFTHATDTLLAEKLDLNLLSLSELSFTPFFSRSLIHADQLSFPSNRRASQ